MSELKQYKVGYRLPTKDGRWTGNAIITGIDGDSVTLRTDFGNIITRTVDGLKTDFHDPFEWAYYCQPITPDAQLHEQINLLECIAGDMEPAA